MSNIDGFLECMRAIGLDDTQFAAPVMCTVVKELTNFYHDARDFMQSKRFDRFAEMVENKIDKLLVALNIISVSGNECKTKAVPGFYKCFGSAIIEYSARKLNDIRSSEDDTAVLHKQYLHLSVSFLDLISAVPYKLSSPLYDLDEFINDTIDYGELFGGDYYAEIGGIKVDSPLIKPVICIVKDDTFPTLCRVCLERACYDFIHLQSLEQELDDANWYLKIKNVTDEQLIWLMSKTFEHLLYEVEARCGCLVLYSLPENSPAVFSELAKAKETIDEITEQMELKTKQATEAASNRERELQEIRTKYRQLEESLSQKDDNTAELARLKRQLKMMEQENQSLKDRLASAEQYADELQKAMNESDNEAVVNTAVDPALFADKRIVFIRDKANENFVIMKRLAEAFPTAKFTNCIASDINAKATDLIVVFTSYVHHHTFWNATSIAKRKQIPIISTSKANYDMILNDIVKAFDGQKGVITNE